MRPVLITIRSHGTTQMRTGQREHAASKMACFVEAFRSGSSNTSHTGKVHIPMVELEVIRECYDQNRCKGKGCNKTNRKISIDTAKFVDIRMPRYTDVVVILQRSYPSPENCPKN